MWQVMAALKEMEPRELAAAVLLNTNTLFFSEKDEAERSGVESKHIVNVVS